MSASEPLPSILIVSTSSTKPKSLIKLITKETPTEHPNSPIITQPWQIETKYYTSNVNIIGINENYNRTNKFNERVEALILHMDCNRTTGLEDLNQWEPLEGECKPEVKLLISNYCNNSTKITKQEVEQWCLKRNFEFIELYAKKTADTEDESGIIVEKFGLDRVIEALQTHTWSNLVMKPKLSSNAKSPRMSDNSNSEFCSDDIDDFSQLFSQLNSMKDSLQSMDISQRKQCAEQMVTAFWKAMGGEEEELLDI